MKSLEELRKIKEEVQQNLKNRNSAHSKKIVVCMGTCGIAAGARETMKAFMEELENAGMSDVAVTATGCIGFCEQEPLISVEIAGQEPVRYGKVDAAAAKRIVDEHIGGGTVVSEFVFG